MRIGHNSFSELRPVTNEMREVIMIGLRGLPRPFSHKIIDKPFDSTFFGRFPGLDRSLALVLVKPISIRFVALLSITLDRWHRLLHLWLPEALRWIAWRCIALPTSETIHGSAESW